MRIQARHIYLYILIACAILSFIYISVLPVAWFDELMDLDPAARWVLTGKHASIAWPFQGSGKLCLVNLPLRELPFILATWVFGPHIWAVRLVFYLLAIITASLLYKIAKISNMPTHFAWFVVAVVVLDKGFLEMMRGCRPEVMELALAFAIVLLSLRQAHVLATLVCIVAIYLHPSTWVFLAVFLGYNLFQISGLRTLWALGFAILTILIFNLYIQGNWSLFIAQYWHSAQVHSVPTGFLSNIGNHFYLRWLHYWQWEWWWLAGYAGVHVLLVLRFKHLTALAKLLAISIVLTGVFWFFVLTHNYRYTVFLNGLVALFYMQYLPVMHWLGKRKWLHWVVLAIVLVPFAGRLVVAQAHYAQRNPYSVLTWLHKNVPANNTLLIGESIGGYWSLQNPNTTQFAHHTMAHNAHFSAFKNVFLLSRNQKLPVYKQYPLQANPPILGKSIVGKSYAGICLYHITDSATFNSIVSKQ